MSSEAGWVKGVKNGKPFFFNIFSQKQTFIRPVDFRTPPTSPRRRTKSFGPNATQQSPQQACTEDAVKEAAEQLRAGIITQQEYDIIVSTIEKGQEVDDIDQFLNHGELRKFQSTESLPDEVVSDPSLLITDLSTGKKVHVVEANAIAPVHHYDSFENLYVTDITTGKRIFLNEVQIEQFDTFSQTQKRLGARAGAAELRRQAKKLRDAAPAQLQLKLFDALRDLDTALQTPKGQQALEEESSYFGGSLLKTRMAMVMAVQMKLKRSWERNPPSPRRKRRGQPRPVGSEELMSLAEFVDVVRFMGFEATLENAADVIDRWGKADRAGRIHFVNFLVWADLEECFPRKSDPITAQTPGGTRYSATPRFQSNTTTSPKASGPSSMEDGLVAAAAELSSVTALQSSDRVGAADSPSSPRSSAEQDDTTPVREPAPQSDDEAGDETEKIDLLEEEDERDELESERRLEEEMELYRLLQQKYTTIVSTIETFRQEAAETGEADEEALAAAVEAASKLKTQMEELDAAHEAEYGVPTTKTGDLALTALGVQHTKLDGWMLGGPAIEPVRANIGRSLSANLDDPAPPSAGTVRKPQRHSSGGFDSPKWSARSGPIIERLTQTSHQSQTVDTYDLLKEKYDNILKGIAAAEAGTKGEESIPIVAAAKEAAAKLKAQLDQIHHDEALELGAISVDEEFLEGEEPEVAQSPNAEDDTIANLARAAAAGHAIARSKSANLDELQKPRSRKSMKMQRHSSGGFDRDLATSPDGAALRQSSQQDIFANAEAAAAAAAFSKREEGLQAPTTVPDISQMEPIDVAKVAFPFNAVGSTELSIIAGEVLAIYNRLESGWWYAMNELGEEGFVPMTYLEGITEDDVARAAQNAQSLSDFE